MSTTQQRFIDALANQMGVDPLTIKSDTRPDADLGMDSLEGQELLLMAEDEFGIRIRDEDAAACTTVADWVAMIERKTAEVKA